MSDKHILLTSNVAIIVFVAAFSISLVLAYGFEQEFSLATLTLLHVTQIIWAGLAKLAYVVRLVTQKQLGLEVR